MNSCIGVHNIHINILLNILYEALVNVFNGNYKSNI